MSAPQPVLVRFGNFEVDQRSCELRKHGLKIKLQRKPFQVLIILLERRGEVVSREELQRSLWAEDVFVDFDHGLNTAIKKLRYALGDTAASPRYIATVDRKGYRFAADVQEIELPVMAQSPPIAPIELPAGQPPPAKHRPARLGRYWIAVAALILIATGYFTWRFTGRREPAGDGRVMLAVLPFENLTGDPAQDYFSDGLTEEMISQIGSIDPQRLGVIARTSAMRYKHTEEPLEQIGRELGVSYVLEGSVRRDEQRVRISAQLVQVKDQSHLWTRQYDRDLRELLSLQEEIGQEIADEIQLALGGKSTAKAHRVPASAETSYEAYDLYLRGLYFWNKRYESLQRATEYFQQAIAKDPNYARAYAALANTYGLIATYTAGPQQQLMPKARSAALKALQLDGSIAEAHAALALVAERYDYDWQTADREFRLAIQLDPGYATAHQWYGEYLSWQGRFDDALAESERARQLDPMSLIIRSDYADILYRARQYDRAIAEARAIADMDPSFEHPWGYLVFSYVRKGQFSEALDFVGRYVRPRDPNFASIQEGVIYAGWGRKTDAERAFKYSAPCDPTGPGCDNLLLSEYAAMGRKDDAVALLQQLYAERSSVITELKTEPTFDFLRGDPRFQELLRRVHLDQ